MSWKTTDIRLEDWYRPDGKTMIVRLERGTDYVAVEFPGFPHPKDESRVVLRYRDGKPVISLWLDDDSEDPSHTFTIGGDDE